jgi:hypothetical protein
MRVALVVLVLLAGCGKMTQAKMKSALVSACAARSAAELSVVDDPACPTMSTLHSSHKLSGERNDPWGHEFHVDCKNDDVTVSSDGPDGKSDTSDDVRATTDSCKPFSH